MRYTRSSRRKQALYRRGAITVYLAVLLLPLLAFTAYCVDVGWISLTKSELQNAADASAAAGAAQLVENYAPYARSSSANRPALISAAQQSATNFAVTFAGHNSAGDKSSLQLPTGDIQIGFTDANGTFQSSYAGYPNTVQVITRRDSSANTPLTLFFAPLLGVQNTALTATSGATIYTGLITSFNPQGGGEGGGTSGGAWGEDYGSSGAGFACGLLPVAFDVNTWNNFFATGQSPNGVVYQDGTGTPQIQIYPSPNNAPGNFGMLCIGPWTNSNSQYSDWVLDGPTADDLQTLIDEGKFPVSQSAPKAWKGSPGLRNSLKSDFETIIGQPRLLPLFKPAAQSPYQAASGAGSNASYAIVGFAGVTVSQVSGNGGNLSIMVKPCAVIDPTAVFDPATIYPAGAEPSTQLKSFTHPGVKLTR